MAGDGAEEIVVSQEDLCEQLAVSADRRDHIASLRAEMRALRRQVIGAIALMPLAHLCAVWGTVAAHAP